MRLWSLDPALLDRAALVACWRETLLAQKVLAGLTRGYTNHPQLQRFRACEAPMEAVGFYLTTLRDEATQRGYSFDGSRITVPSEQSPLIPVTDGQVAYELEWLRTKVSARAPEWLPRLDAPAAGRTFVVRPGDVEPWERV